MNLALVVLLAIGGVIPLRLYAMERNDPKDVAARYVALMRNGYTAPAETLLNRFSESI